MDKYYKPDISDLFIGYECEGNMDKFKMEKLGWLPLVLKGIGPEVVEYHSQGVYRTPYLTKEQIEKEGWKYYSTLSENNIENITALVYQKDGFTCRMSVTDRNLSFFNKQINEDEWWVRPIYHGKCPSINEFRKICKLLEI